MCKLYKWDGSKFKYDLKDDNFSIGNVIELIKNAERIIKKDSLVSKLTPDLSDMMYGIGMRHSFYQIDMWNGDNKTMVAISYSAHIEQFEQACNKQIKYGLQIIDVS